MRNPGDVLNWLDTALHTHSDTYGYSVILDAIEEIERMRAGQFRWIAVSERTPKSGEPEFNGPIVCIYEKGGVQISTGQFIASYGSDVTHWAPIPPLPERTQEEKDEELWKQYAEKNNFLQCAGEHNLRYGFLAGLKAARGEK